MLYLYKNPSWIDARLLQEKKVNEIPPSLFEEINQGLTALQSEEPLVSVCIPAFNEETSILRTVHSLSRSKTTYPVEIIIVNNNSTDGTQEVLDKLKVRSFFQPKPGWGPARQMAQEKARGKFILSADADCIYPPNWIQKMTTALLKPGVSCVYGGYSFLAPADKSRFGYFVYESFKNLVVGMRDIKRPWFNCGGASMGYVRELSLKIGFIDRMIRGEDGRMAFELAQRGKIVRVRGAIVWTSPRSLYRDGTLMQSFVNRFFKECKRLRNYLRPQPVHDTHTSNNSVYPPDLRKKSTALTADVVKETGAAK
jgi:glycosyltransferase involved in cell wall biosynthesis